MKYNAKYDRWVSKDGLVYRYDKKNDKLVLCYSWFSKGGYKLNRVRTGNVMQHRIVWETYKGSIPDGMQIDHINTIRTDNRLENLRLVTPKENSNNSLTIKHIIESRFGKAFSDFGTKYKEHFGYGMSVDKKQYKREWIYYKRHKICSWEVEDKCKS